MPARCLRWFLSSKAILYLGSCKHKMLREPSRWTLWALQEMITSRSSVIHKNSQRHHWQPDYHFTTTKNALLLVWTRYERTLNMLLIFLPATTRCIHWAYACKNVLQGFSMLCSNVSSTETITWNPSSFTRPQFSLSLCMECRKLMEAPNADQTQTTACVKPLPGFQTLAIKSE